MGKSASSCFQIPAENSPSPELLLALHGVLITPCSQQGKICLFESTLWLPPTICISKLFTCLLDPSPKVRDCLFQEKALQSLFTRGFSSFSWDSVAVTIY